MSLPQMGVWIETREIVRLVKKTPIPRMWGNRLFFLSKKIKMKEY